LRPSRSEEPLVEFFIYCRDKPDTDAILEELAEAHWSFIDGYADAMIARGPTLTPDRTRHTGSMHIIDVTDDDAAHAFAFEEPYFQAGVYAHVLIHRWVNELGRTMWDFRSEATDHQRFLVIGLGRPGASSLVNSRLEDHRRYLAEGRYEERIIQRGPLLSDGGAEWVGDVMLVEVPGRAAVEAMVSGDPYASAGLYSSVEIHDWEFGGRPQRM
jgi:uncharacterized protein YciI